MAKSPDWCPIIVEEKEGALLSKVTYYDFGSILKSHFGALVSALRPRPLKSTDIYRYFRLATYLTGS